MTPRTRFQNRLKFLGACREARGWVGARTAKQAWAECPRMDWLHWYAMAELRRTYRTALAQASRAYFVATVEPRLMLGRTTFEDRCALATTADEARRAYQAATLEAWYAYDVAMADVVRAYDTANSPDEFRAMVTRPKMRARVARG